MSDSTLDRKATNKLKTLRKHYGEHERYVFFDDEHRKYLRAIYPAVFRHVRNTATAQTTMIEAVAFAAYVKQYLSKQPLSSDK